MPMWDQKTPPKFIPEHLKPRTRFNESGYLYVQRNENADGAERTKSELLVTISNVNAAVMTGRGIPRFIDPTKLTLPVGYAFMVDENNNYYVDQDGKLIITETF